MRRRAGVGGSEGRGWQARAASAPDVQQAIIRGGVCGERSGHPRLAATFRVLRCSLSPPLPPLPLLPAAPAGKYMELEFATLGDKKLRSQLRNAAELELQARAGASAAGAAGPGAAGPGPGRGEAEAGQRRSAAAAGGAAGTLLALSVLPVESPEQLGAPSSCSPAGGSPSGWPSVSLWEFTPCAPACLPARPPAPAAAGDRHADCRAQAPGQGHHRLCHGPQRLHRQGRHVAPPATHHCLPLLLPCFCCSRCLFPHQRPVPQHAACHAGLCARAGRGSVCRLAS